MGLFSFIKGNSASKITVYDLLYAYMRRSTDWGPSELTWAMKNCYGGYDFSKSWNRIQELNLIQEINGAAKLTDLATAQLNIHDYIPIVVKECKMLPHTYENMFRIRAKNPNISAYAVIALSFDEEDFYDENCYFENDMDNADKADVRAAIRRAKKQCSDCEKYIESLEAKHIMPRKSKFLGYK